MANIMALVCSAAFPTIGSRITLIKAIGIPHDSEAPCYARKDIILNISISHIQ